MTIEEAKEVFLNRGFVNGLFDGNKWRQSIVVISEWLKQESCEDAISRDEVLKQINCWIGSGEYKYTNATYYLTRRMQELPPVTPKPKIGWIPVSERLPEKDGEYLVTTIKGDVDIYVFHTWGAKSPKIIAWMSLPQSYKAESEETDADSN